MNRWATHFVSKPTAVWIVAGVSFFVIGWRLYIFSAEYFGVQKLADKFTAIRQFRQDLIPNHANTRLVFCQDTEEGVGIYVCNTDGGQPHLLCTKKENALQWRRFSMLGWSPDDSVFACALPDEKQEKESILIFDGATGEQLAQIGADQGLYQLAWLTAESFAYSTHTDIRVVTKQGNEWEHKRHFEKVAVNLDDFTSISDHSVAWRDAGAIWLLDLRAGQPQNVWESKTSKLDHFTYAKSSGEFLINCSDDNGQQPYFRFSPDSKTIVDAGRVENQQYNFVSNVKWSHGDPRYAYVSRLNSTGQWPDLCIQVKPDQAPVRVPWEGWAENFTLNGDHLFFQGSENGQQPGIWEYNIKSGTARCVVSGSNGDSGRVKITAPLIGSITNALGNAKAYYLWRPAQISAGKKYPLIITKQFWNWFPYNQIAVNEGCFFAIVDENCVAALNEALAKNPNVDAKHIYLYESSAGTAFASELMAENSEPWKGAILFSPTELPDATRLLGKKILLVAGKDDEEVSARLSKYQNEAAASGTPVTLCILPAAGHLLESGKSERVRAREFARFLWDNRQ